jgi:hypothetical protein
MLDQAPAVGPRIMGGGVVSENHARPGADLVGRLAELDLIDSILAGPYPARTGLLFRGEPGPGKTAVNGNPIKPPPR